MKVYAVFSKQYGGMGSEDEWDQLESIYSNRELAENHANHEIGEYFVQEINVLNENNEYTKYAMERVKSGKVKFVKGSAIF